MNYTDLAPGHIRLLNVLPSRYHKATLRCQLSVQPLKYAIYEALSYVWGTSISMQKIIVNEEEVNVTSNLLAALRCLRDSQATRTIWVDALCINQENQDEKSRQVRMMGDIYRNATFVLCWLGDAIEPGVMLLIHEFSKLRTRKPPPIQFEESVSTESGQGSEDAMPLDGPQLDLITLLCLTPNLMDLLRNEYFCRVWTVQEMALGRRVVVFSGQLFAYWAGFDEFFPHWLYNHIGEIDDDNIIFFIYSRFLASAFTHKTGQALARGRGVADISFLDTLIKYRGRKASDPRDKVFGLLELCSHPGFEADYSKTTAQVFKDVSRYIIETDHNLDVLSAVATIGFNQKRTERKTISNTLNTFLGWVRPFFIKNSASDVSQTRPFTYNLPSWAVDWGQSPEGGVYLFLDHVRSSLYNASCGSLPLATFPDDECDTLELGGVLIGQVRACYQCEEFTGAWRDIFCVPELINSTWDCWARNRTEKVAYDGEKSEMTALLRTMSADQGSQFLCEILTSGLARIFWEGEFASLLADAAKEELDRLRPTSSFILERDVLGGMVETWGRVSALSLFCVTDSGFMGRVPLAAQEGDIIVVLAGGKTPFVLRYDHSKSSYSLIGDCCKLRLLSPEDDVDRS